MAALITGGSNGIGLERARIFANDGADVVLVARVDALRVEVDALVNNAGFGVYGPFLETPLETEPRFMPRRALAKVVRAQERRR